MTAFRALPFLILLAACVDVGPDPATPEGQCQVEVENDPAVQDVYRRMPSGSLYGFGTLEAMKEIKQQAYERCMRNRGLAPLGGVESTRRFPSPWN